MGTVYIMWASCLCSRLCTVLHWRFFFNSGDRRTFVGGEVYYFLYLAIFGFSVEESYYIPERLFRLVEYDEMIIWSCEDIGVLLSKTYNYIKLYIVYTAETTLSHDVYNTHN